MARSRNSEILISLSPSPARRHLGIGMVVVLGIVLLYTAVDVRQASLLAPLVLGGLGIGSLLMAWKMHTSTRLDLHLREDGVYSSDGVLVAELRNIKQVERGMFAFKPSNGFTIVLKTSMSRAWHPGLWWRFGRRVGVGGVTPQAQGKLMAERLEIMLQNPN